MEFALPRGQEPGLPQLLLLRHGIAEERSEQRPDAQRALTAAGVRRTTAVLERAVSLGLGAPRLLASPLVRARQTAEIALAVGLAPALELAQGLEPEGDPLPLLQAWLACPPVGRLVLVGHEPDLGNLAARLLGAPVGSIVLRKAGLALLERVEAGPPADSHRTAAPGFPLGPWRLRLLLTPRILLA